MKLDQEEVLGELYNLLLNKGTREWERGQLNTTKEAVESGGKLKEQLAILEAQLRPLASRNNLTPDVADFYLKIKDEPEGHIAFDFEKHLLSDLKNQERAIFAGGCFWCMVEPFEKRPGIISVLSGYTGGELASPTYDQVSGGYTNHVEAVEIIFDTRLVSYAQLLALYWQLIDPTDAFGQFQDRGSQYRSIIFVQNESQKQAAEQAKAQVIASGKYTRPIVTEIRLASPFWPAENYHQQFYQKQPKRYRRIKRARQQLVRFQSLKDKVPLRKPKPKK